MILKKVTLYNLDIGALGPPPGNPEPNEKRKSQLASRLYYLLSEEITSQRSRIETLERRSRIIDLLVSVTQAENEMLRKKVRFRDAQLQAAKSDEYRNLMNNGKPV